MNDFDTVNMNKLQKAVYYFREYGFEYTKNRALKKLGIPVPEETEYMNWLRKRSPRKKDLEEQRKKCALFSREVDVVIDATPGLLAGSSLMEYSLPGDSSELLRSLKKQSYGGTVKTLEGREGESLPRLLSGLEGEIVVFAEADHALAPDYLYEVLSAFMENPGRELIYTDEDLRSDEKHRFRPYFKPDISPELFLSFQYIGGVFAVRRSLLERAEAVLLEAGEKAFFGNFWYELLSCLLSLLLNEDPEAAAPDDIGSVHPRSVYHLPKPVFSRFAPKDFKGFQRILSDQQWDCAKRHLRRLGREGEVYRKEVPGFFGTRYVLPGTKPLVSVLIPTRDHFEDLDLCIRSLLEKSDYPEYEFIIAENNSQDPATFAYYDRLCAGTYTGDQPLEGKVKDKTGREHRVVVVTWKEGFNYSGINNFASRYAKGEFLLLLNNDTEFRDAAGLSELVSAASLPGVGAAGAMLYYGDGTIQHGGVIYKIGGFAANALWSLTDRDEAYYPYSVTMREMSCCTAACLLLRREAFEAAGGFDEKLAVALNDVDLCLKVRRAGYKIIFNPSARLFHYESKSRGSEEESKEKQERFNREISYFQEKWQDELDRGDPYYNVNQTLHYANYSIELAEDNRGRYRA